MAEEFRLATEDDSDALLSVYSHYVTDTVVSMELEPPTPEAFRKRVAGIMAVYPYLVCEEKGGIAGYAYADRAMERAGYQYNATVSVYLRPECRGRGLGKELYRRLLALLSAQGIVNVYAVITLPNPASLALHTGFGFRDIGVHHQTGYKFGQWHDVAWLEMALGEHRSPPGKVIPLPEVDPELTARLVNGQ